MGTAVECGPWGSGKGRPALQGWLQMVSQSLLSPSGEGPRAQGSSQPPGDRVLTIFWAPGASCCQAKGKLPRAAWVQEKLRTQPGAHPVAVRVWFHLGFSHLSAPPRPGVCLPLRPAGHSPHPCNIYPGKWQHRLLLGIWQCIPTKCREPV